MSKNLFNTRPEAEKQQPSTPSTPRKKSSYKELEPASPKIKYRYTIVEKPTSSWTSKIFFILWICFMVGSFAMSYQSKFIELQMSVRQQIQKCQQDYDVNKCDTPVKGVKLFCQQKLRCVQSNPEEIIKSRTQGTLFMGTIIREFFQGLGFPLVIIGLVYFMFGSRAKSQVKKQFVEYYP